MIATYFELPVIRPLYIRSIRQDNPEFKKSPDVDDGPCIRKKFEPELE